MVCSILNSEVLSTVSEHLEDWLLTVSTIASGLFYFTLPMRYHSKIQFLRKQGKFKDFDNLYTVGYIPYIVIEFICFF